MKSFFIVTNSAAKMERQFNFIFAALIKKASLAKRLHCQCVLKTTEYTRICARAQRAGKYTEMQGLAPPLHPAKAQGALPQ